MTAVRCFLQEEYARRINRVIDYIEGHLDQPLDLETLAREAAFSKYHFHRIFHAGIGETLADFIQRVRLEKAAGLLCLRPDLSVTSIAMSCGFSSSAAFSRSFRRRFSLTAREWRLRKSSPTFAEPTPNFHDAEPRPANLVSLRAETWPDLEVAYIRYRGPYATDAALFEKLFDRLFRWVSARNLLGDQSRIMVYYHDELELTEPGRLRLSVAVSVPPGTTGSGEVGVMRVGGGRLAMGRFLLGALDYGAAWAWMYRRGLPELGFFPEDGLPFEHYPPAKDKDPGDAEAVPVDICIPVVPR